MASKKLSRELSTLSLVAYYFSTVVGAGIFVVPVLAARIAGPASLISWFIALLLAYPFAMIFSHISQRYKVSGTVQKFVEEYTSVKFGESIALFLVASAMVGNFLLGYTASGYICDFFSIYGDKSVCIVTFIVLLVSCIFNLANIGLSSKIQTFAVFLLIVVVLAAVASSIPHFNIEQLDPFMPNGYSSIIAASVLCFYSVTGWENVVAMAEEVKDPNKTYRRAIKIAIALIAFFYLSLVITMILVMSPYEIECKATIMSAILSNTLGQNAGIVGSFIAIFLLFLGCNAWIMGTSRIIFALSRDKVLPKILSNVDQNSHIPTGGVLSQLLCYAILAILMYNLQIADRELAEIASLNYLLLYTVIFFCGLRNFTTIRLKILSSVALCSTTIFLIHSTSNSLQISVVIALICFLHVYLLKRRIR